MNVVVQPRHRDTSNVSVSPAALSNLRRVDLRQGRHLQDTLEGGGDEAVGLLDQRGALGEEVVLGLLVLQQLAHDAHRARPELLHRTKGLGHVGDVRELLLEVAVARVVVLAAVLGRREHVLEDEAGVDRQRHAERQARGEVTRLLERVHGAVVEDLRRGDRLGQQAQAALEGARDVVEGEEVGADADVVVFDAASVEAQQRHDAGRVARAVGHLLRQHR
mmetsp:Transcript_54757/g.168716  ORF Transcript_54757/g.168716 Transcript_54757/m.168716 type:complete len:220 (+) Transcript_54757:344-1003(+)